MNTAVTNDRGNRGKPAARTRTDLEQDMYPRILAGAVIAAAQVTVRRWSAADPPVPLGPLLRRVLGQLATACSGPLDGRITLPQGHPEEFRDVWTAGPSPRRKA
jgi:hypothetical protein